VYRWPLRKEGGPKASENALHRDFPVDPMTGSWISPNMHNVVRANGKKYNVVVIPDRDMKVVNRGGSHSIRGGCLAQKVYNPDTPTRDRLQHPMLRVNGELVRVPWDTALDVFAEVSQHVLDKYGEHSWAQKMYSYQYFENTYALTKFALRHINTPAFALHDNPSDAPSTPGFRDVGIDPFGPAYEDWGNADTLYIAGTDPFETKTVLWNEWIMPAIGRGQKVIMVNPRRTSGVAYAEASGGLHLELYPGTDTVLHLAIARLIIERGWQDQEWIDKYTANRWDSNAGFGRGVRDTPWQWRTTWGEFQTDGYHDYKKWLFAQKESGLDYAAEVTGVPAEKIVRAAELMARPRADGSRPKTSLAVEKGLYWSNNYLNTASLATLGLLCGAGNRPGQMIGRLGGHQRGMTRGGSYPLIKSPDKFGGRRRKTLDLDRWVEMGHVRFAYVIGTTWIGSMCASQALEATFRRMTTENPHQLTSTNKNEVIDTLKRRVDSGGMVIANQEIYLRYPMGTDLTDIVLPAATWGEENFTRENGERRLRLYSKFYDPPGEAKPDWWIVAQIAKRMGFEGFDWKDSNEVFEELTRFNRGNRRNFQPLVMFGKREGKTGHEKLREFGTEGIQTPIRIENGKLVGTKRLHDTTLELPETGPEGFTHWPKTLVAFNTHSGKAHFMKSPWWIFGDFFEWQKPKGDELWVTNGRINEIWQSGFDDVERRPYITQRWPENFIEIHPDDARARGVESGDWVEVYSDRVPVQKSGFMGVKVKSLTFSELMKNGHIELESGSYKAIAIVTDALKPGVAFANFLDPKNPSNTLAPRVPDPISNNYRYKLGVGKIRRLGESKYKRSFAQMSFARRSFI
jgi:arsenite oxidase large subunit